MLRDICGRENLGGKLKIPNFLWGGLNPLGHYADYAEQDKNKNENKEQAINTTNGTAHQSPTRHAYFGDLVLI